MSDFWNEGPPIDGRAGRVGDLVFWDGRKPWWIVEWQPQNGRVFVVVDATGNIGTAGPDELTRDFRKAGERQVFLQENLTSNEEVSDE